MEQKLRMQCLYYYSNFSSIVFVICYQIILCFLKTNKYLNAKNTVKQNPHRWCKWFGHIKKHPNIWKQKRYDNTKD